MTKLQQQVFNLWLTGNGYKLENLTVGQYGKLYNDYRKARSL